MGVIGNLKVERLRVDASYKENAVAGETLSVPAGAAGSVVDAYFAQKPIASANKDWVGSKGNTSINFTGGDVFDTEVEYKTADSDLSNGEYWVDYVTGRLRGKKASTNTSMTVDYSSFTNV